MGIEERQLDLGAKPLGRFRSELDVAERGAVASCPAAVQPRADDERRHVGHAIPQGAPIAAHVVREDRLPHRRAQASHRHRAADHVPENVMERATNLEQRREQMRRLVELRRPHTRNVQPVLDVEPEALPAVAAVAFGARDERPPVVLVTAVEQIENDVLVQQSVGIGCGTARDQPFTNRPG